MRLYGGAVYLRSLVAGPLSVNHGWTRMNVDVRPEPGRLRDGCGKTHAMRLYGGVVYLCSSVVKSLMASSARQSAAGGDLATPVGAFFCALCVIC